jgi:acyl-CoA synthetase (AMP-forming)/AMP-acid ligase II
VIDQLSEQFFATLLEAQPTWAHMIGELEHAGSYEDASRAAEDLFVNKMRAFATGKLAHYKIPRYVLLVDDFPMTVTGKVRKVQMREETAAQLGLTGAGHGPAGASPGTSSPDRVTGPAPPSVATE